MAAGCWAVPAVPTGARLSSGRPAVTALVPLRNLLGHRALPAKISQGRAMTGDDGRCGLNRKVIGGTHRKTREDGQLHLPNPRAPEKNGRAT